MVKWISAIKEELDAIDTTDRRPLDRKCFIGRFFREKSARRAELFGLMSEES